MAGSSRPHLFGAAPGLRVTGQAPGGEGMASSRVRWRVAFFLQNKDLKALGLIWEEVVFHGG